MDEYKMGYFQHTGHITTILNLSKLNFLTYNNFCKKKNLSNKIFAIISYFVIFSPISIFWMSAEQTFSKAVSADSEGGLWQGWQ